MAAIDGHELDFGRSREGMGGLLDAPCSVDAEIDVPGGRVRFQADSVAVVAYLDSEMNDPDALFREGYRLLQQALDVASMRHGLVSSFDDLFHRHTLWWTSDQSAVTLRWSGCQASRITSTASWVVEHEDGSTEHSPETGYSPWSEALRYYRKSQAATSAADAYRDMYLAMEQVMSFAEPNTSGGEGAWTRRALTALIQLGVEVDTFAGSLPDPVQAFMDRFYATRNGHSHAKAGKPHLVPFDLDDRDQVLVDLEWLGQLVLHAFYVLGWDETVPGGMVITGVRLMNENMELTLFVSDDNTPVAVADVDVSPAGGVVHKLTTSFEGQVDSEGFDYAWLGQIESSRLGSPEVGRAAACFWDQTSRSFTPWAVENSPDLNVSGTTTFEYRLVHVHEAVFGRVRRHYAH